MHQLHYTLCTPANVAGAIAVIQIRPPAGEPSETLDRFCAHAGFPTSVGSVALRDLFGVDTGLAVRWDEAVLELFPHGGIAIVRTLTAALEALGLRPNPGPAYPEAVDVLEERMLRALATVPSPLAIDLLLDQPRRWRAHTPGEPLADDRSLRRLLEPPLVVAVGPPNIGKSTLLNALAGRSVSIVADLPGTTRDHVGATLDLGGLVVRYLDTPGRLDRATGIDRAAIELADRAAQRATLVLSCGDPTTPALEAFAAEPSTPVVRVCLRSDLGEPAWKPDCSVSVRREAGLPQLVEAIRHRLVPPEVLGDDRPWKFWSDEPGSTGGPSAGSVRASQPGRVRP